MALVQTPEMTEKNLSAHRQNGRQSRGAATAEGKERARAANLRHGYYSKINDQALTALGEDPQALAALIAGAHAQWRPANPHQAWITERMARLQWKIDRADRLQENAMALPVQRVESRRREKALQTRYCYADVHGFLSVLSADTLRPDYYTPPGYFPYFARAFRVNTGARMEEILRLLHRLRQPGGYAVLTGRLPAGATAHKGWKEVRELYEDGSAIPQPDIPIAQGAEREELRADLHALAAEELVEVELVWEEKLLPEADQPLSQQERDELAADTYKKTELMRREEHSCLREFIRLGTLLLKLQAGESSEGRSKGAKKRDEMQQPGSGAERKPTARCGEMQQSDSDCHATPVTSNRPSQGASPTATRKNAGASGDVDENKGEGKCQGADFQHHAPQEVVEIRVGPAKTAAPQPSL